MITVRLPEELENRLNAISQETGRSKSYYIRNALVEYIEDLEDLAAAEKALKEIKEGKDAVISYEELKKELGL